MYDDDEKENLLTSLHTVTVLKVNGTNRVANEHVVNLYQTISMLCHTLNKYIATKSEVEGHEYELLLITEEWRCVAAILDRIFLVTYLIVILTSLVLLFPR